MIDKERQKRKRVQYIKYYSMPVFLIILWEILGRTGHIKEYIFPTLEKVGVTAWQLLENTVLLEHIGASIVRVILGFVLAGVIGITLGVLVAISKYFYYLADCTLQILKPIPPIGWIPLAILVFGIEEQSKIFIIFLGAFFPIFSNVVDGIFQIEGKYMEVAQVLELPKSVFIKKVILLGALPSIMTGLRIGLGSAWMCVVAAEMIAATKGIGYMLMDGRSLSKPELVILGMILIGVIGKIMNDILLKVEEKRIHWQVKK